MPQTLTPEQQKAKQERMQAKVGLASNALGLTAGTAGLVAAAKNPALRQKFKTTGSEHMNPPLEPKEVGGPVTRRLAHKLKKPSTRGKLIAAGAAGAAGLQALNIGGDVVANRVMSRAAGEPNQKVKKSDLAELGDIAKFQLAHTFPQQPKRERHGGREAAGVGTLMAAGGIGSIASGANRQNQDVTELARRAGTAPSHVANMGAGDQVKLAQKHGMPHSKRLGGLRGGKRMIGGALATGAGLGAVAASPVIGSYNTVRGAGEKRRAKKYGYPQ